MKFVGFMKKCISIGDIHFKKLKNLKFDWFVSSQANNLKFYQMLFLITSMGFLSLDIMSGSSLTITVFSLSLKDPLKMDYLEPGTKSKVHFFRQRVEYLKMEQRANFDQN